MTQEQHPITPPPELVRQWTNALGCPDMPSQKATYIATEAARWGYQQAMEPEPEKPSLKEQALEALEHIVRYSSTDRGAETIRRALEALPDD